MKKGINREMLSNAVKDGIIGLSKNHKIVEVIANYVDEQYNIPRKEVFDIFNDFGNLDKLDIVELALIGEKVLFEYSGDKKMLNTFFNGSEIMNMRDYKRLDWKHKPHFIRSKKSSFVYNAGFKNAFVNIYEKDSIKRVQTINLFKSIGKYELKIGKDLFDMNLYELDLLLGQIGYKSFNSAIRDIVLINRYIKWAIENDYSSIKEERVISTSRNNTDKYVYSNLNSHYTLEELTNALLKSDKLFYLIGMCIFNGIGAVDFSEIQNLKVNQLIKNENKYYVKLERGDIEISESLYSQLIDFNNVEVLNNCKFKFVMTDKIFKPFHRSIKKEEVVINKSVRNRLVNFMKEEMEDDSFTIRTIVRSGFDYHAFKLISESHTMVLNTSVLNGVSDRFNTHKNKIGYYHGRMLDEMSVDFIKSNYGEFEIDSYLANKINN